MPSISLLPYRSLWIACLCVVASGCAASTPSDGTPTHTASTHPDGRLPNEDAIVAITVSPATLTLDVDSASPQSATAQYAATGTTAAGATVALLGNWSIDRPDLADVDVASGALVATGLRGGNGVVTFKYQGLSATATIKLRLGITGTAIPSDVATSALAATQADPTLAIVYPYNETVFPRGLFAPTLQWNGGLAPDHYIIRIESDTFSFVDYVDQATAPSKYDLPTLPQPIWSRLTDSTVGDVDVSVQRITSSGAYLAAHRTWRIADANLKGTIFYTSLSNNTTTTIMKIQPGRSTPDVGIPVPQGHGCVACHSVSANGRRIVAAVDGGASPWGTYDAVTGAPLYQSNQASGFEAISPDGEFVLWRHWTSNAFPSNGSLTLSRYDSDAALATFTPPAPPTGVGGPSHPVWSVDGKHVAFSIREQANGLNFTQSTLWVTDVDTMLYTFTNTRKIIDFDPTLKTTTYPSFSPDSHWLAFGRASSAATSAGHHGELWITDSDGLTPARLDRANGAGDVPNADLNWGPTFHPIAAGGYYWLAFFSARPYGNQFSGANRQLWLTAIDANITPGQDPSHPSIYVVGQNQTTTNERPQFTRDACRELGESCENGFDCCGGFCRPDGNGALTCQMPPAQTCSQLNEACVSSTDCCDTTLSCLGGFCAQPIP